MTGPRAIALVAVWTVPSIAFLAFTWCIYSTWRIVVPPRLGPEARTAVMVSLRDALDRGVVETPQHPSLARRLARGGPVAATLWLDGLKLGRIDGHGDTVAEATRAAAEQLANHPAVKLAPEQRAKLRIHVDVVVGRGPIQREHWLLKLVALHPGLEGLAVTVRGDDRVQREVMLMPDEMFLRGLLEKQRFIKELPDIGMGVELARADRLLAEAAGVSPRIWPTLDRRYVRFRTDAFVEAPGGAGAPLALERGLPPGPPVTADTLEAAALEGARYLVAHLGPNGRYVYEQNLTTGQATDPMRGGAYSMPRHAGTTYFLAEAYRLTQASWLREPIERAFAHLDSLLVQSSCKGTTPSGEPFACVADKGERRPVLGSTALTVVALAEYQRATGDTRYLDMATRLSAFMLMLQRPDGSFAHVYDLNKKAISHKEMLLYFSGEAALAMARMYTITGDERYAVSAEKALDWLVGWYDFFVGGFLYGEEHWTCIASEALWPRVAKQKYLEFCNGLTRFWGKAQPWPGDYPDQPDLAGAHMVTPFLMPQNTPAGSHSEASLSTYLLGRHMGKPEPWLREQILATLYYLLRQQIRPENDFAVVASAKGNGALPGSPVDRVVRIDYVQHVCSAMLRGVELAREVPRTPAYP